VKDVSKIKEIGMASPRLGLNGNEQWTSKDDLSNTVVQVVAQVAQFNWIDPYRVQQQFEGRGSGFFVDSSGHFITNAHVVNEASKVWIHLPTSGQKTIFADIVGFCPDRDLALLKVVDEDLEFIRSECGGITPLPFGDSDLIQPAEPVVVLGYPLGQHRMKTVTGVISGRESAEGRLLIQITAPINPGNSGGPLLNEDGEVIGIAIASVLEAQNVGYAIPINEVKMVLDDLYKNKLVRKGSFGTRFNYGSEELVDFLGNPKPAGLYVNKVFKGSLFEKSGVCEGDMLYEMNGFRLDAFGDTTVPWSNDKFSINDLVGRLCIGELVKLVIYRKGERKEISFNFEMMPSYPVRWMFPGYEPVEYEIFGGMVIMELADNHIPHLMEIMPYLIDYTKPENKMESVPVITNIIPGSLAQQLRSLAPGFLLREINGVQVTTLLSVRTALEKSVTSGIVTLKTTEGVFAVMPFKELVHDEERLSRDFNYPISSFMKGLIKKVA
jgi:serine protease Do